MIVEPRRGVAASQLEEKLRYVHTSTFNVFNGSSGVRDQIEQYLRWVGESERVLRPVLVVDDLNRFLLTRRYWATHSNPSYSAANVLAVQEQVRDHQQEFEALTRAVNDERRRWAEPEPEAAFVIADTNVHLHHPAAWRAIDWRGVIGWRHRSRAATRLVIPMLVVDELDNAKRSSNDRTRGRAAAILRLIYEVFGSDPATTWQMQPVDLDHASVRANLLMDGPIHQRLERPDDELVDRALMLKDFVDHPVYFVTYDTGAALRARSEGLAACRLVHGEDGN